jgi:DNA-directed RNA polymerase specialized sigma24 family protein
MEMKKKDWTLTQQAFDKLLAWLDPDRRLAAEKLENIRHKLFTYFKWRRCSAPEDLVDETIDRVAYKIEEIRTNIPEPYVLGVARNVLREHWKTKDKRSAMGLEELLPSQQPSDDPLEAEQELESSEQNEQRLECLEQCLRELSPESHSLIKDYHAGEKRVRIMNRQNLAEYLGINLAALRKRVYQITLELRSCCDGCVGRLSRN